LKKVGADNFDRVGEGILEMWGVIIYIRCEADMEQLQSSSFQQSSTFPQHISDLVDAYPSCIVHTSVTVLIHKQFDAPPSVCMLYDFFKSPVHRCNNTMWFPTIILQPRKMDNDIQWGLTGIYKIFLDQSSGPDGFRMRRPGAVRSGG